MSERGEPEFLQGMCVTTLLEVYLPQDNRTGLECTMEDWIHEARDGNVRFLKKRDVTTEMSCVLSPLVRRAPSQGGVSEHPGQVLHSEFVGSGLSLRIGLKQES